MSQWLTIYCNKLDQLQIGLYNSYCKPIIHFRILYLYCLIFMILRPDILYFLRKKCTFVYDFERFLIKV